MYLSVLANPVWNNRREFSNASWRQLQQNLQEFCFPLICNTSQNRVSISQLDLNAESNKGSARKSGDSHPPENFSRGLYDIWQHCQPQMILCQLPDLFWRCTDNKPVRRLLGIHQAEGENRAVRGSECTCYFWFPSGLPPVSSSRKRFTSSEYLSSIHNYTDWHWQPYSITSF